MLAGKKILIAVSGSIAAYKMATTIRLFIKAGAEVRVVMTEAATHFITPLTLSTLSKHPVFSDVSSEEGWHNHVELGLWADAMLVAPATANTLAKMANGLCDNMLLAVYLSARCPVFFAPAMDLDMWAHPATLHNVERLQSFGHHLIPVEEGELASGLVGKGRMAEPEQMLAYLEQYFSPSPQVLTGKKVLITAGPTKEALDPVRFISNHSTGKMGMAIADALAAKGAQVQLVCGPSALQTKSKEIERIDVVSAADMYEATASRFAQADIIILSAAVADYTPLHQASQKMKKSDDDLSIPLKRTVDIAATLGKEKQAHQLMIGFALETQQALENATKKLHKKNLDLIVLNSLEDKGAGFAHDTNKVTFIRKDGKNISLPLQSKAAVAEDLVQQIIQLS